MWTKTRSILKPCFHALLARRSMRANRKPSVKVVNLSCRFSNSLVTGIDQQPCESPEHKSASFLRKGGKENLIYCRRKIICGVSKRAATRNMLFYHLLAYSFGMFSFHTSAQLGAFWEKPKMNEQSTPARRKSIDQWGISTIDVFFVSNRVCEVHEKLG